MADLSRRFGDGQSTRPPGAREAFDTIAMENCLGVRAETDFDTPVDEVKRYLRQGRPVIVWGMFTPPGHVVPIVGYEADHFIVNDSAGVWNEAYLGTHTGRGGAYVKYEADAFLDAITYSGRVELVVPHAE